ncbi:hypothetical protein ACFVXH_39895 [Kitasatospora sp. NPDC058184]|uniref:hypothetical protein n=1 Tax=Kitasatospora sp. NPDC058184 TaxID=3346370 RepID=UPI0036D940B3
MKQLPAPLPEYTWWGQVPAHLRTATQLAALDLPRQPAGPVRAVVTARNPAGRKGPWDLYDLHESVPTAASAAQLVAAAARRTTTRVCAECGARPETPCTPTDDGRALCGTCTHITRLRTRQAEAHAAGRDAAHAAARLLADEHLAVLHIDYTPGQPTAGGNPRPPAAAHITTLDHTGHTLYNRLLRLTGPRTPGAPADALDPGPAAADLAALLADRTVVVWTPAALDPLQAALERLKLPALALPEGRVHTARHAAAHWRADLDPTTGELRRPTPPGTADRLHLLLRRMAATAPQEEPTTAG